MAYTPLLHGLYTSFACRIHLFCMPYSPIHLYTYTPQALHSSRTWQETCGRAQGWRLPTRPLAPVRQLLEQYHGNNDSGGVD